MIRLYLTTAVAGLLLSATLGAQGVTRDTASQRPLSANVPESMVSRVAFTGPSARSSLSLIAPAPAPASTATAVRRDPDAHRSDAMMIVGGVGLLAGAIIGGKAGTVVMIGGAAVGLVGLWDHLK